MVNIEKTQLKLEVSKKTGGLVGFVYCHPRTKKLLGVRGSAQIGKKICLLSDNICTKDLHPNRLYNVSLKSMRDGKGYVIIEVLPVLFKAEVVMDVIPQKRYLITILLGNKAIYYDPINGRSSSSNSIEGVCNLISKREDISNKSEVLDQFLSDAIVLYARMKNDNIVP